MEIKISPILSFSSLNSECCVCVTLKRESDHSMAVKTELHKCVCFKTLKVAMTNNEV